MKNDVKKITFTKMHGLGNDYIYVDCFEPQTADIIAQTDLACLARIFAKKKSATFQKERCTNFRHKHKQKAANDSKKSAAFCVFKGLLKTF